MVNRARNLPQMHTYTHWDSFALSLPLKFDVYLDMFKCYSVFSWQAQLIWWKRSRCCSSSIPWFNLACFAVFRSAHVMHCFELGDWQWRMSSRACVPCVRIKCIYIICMHQLRSLSHRYQVMCSAYLWFLHLQCYLMDEMISNFFFFSVRLGCLYQIIVVVPLCFRLELSEVSAQIHVKSISSSVAVSW